MITSSTVNTASTGTAWKTTTMRGYVYKTALDASQYGDRAYKLTFKDAAGTDYDFFYNIDPEAPSAALAVDATNLVLSKELLGHILTAVWQSGKAEEFELVRDGEGTW